MPAAHTLRTVYAHVLRVDPALASAGDRTLLSSLVAQVDAGGLSLSGAVARVIELALRTTSVANLSYQFFTGLTPRLEGLDYLVSPLGENPNNLDSAYYQSFNLENRYINFAVNLGKHGEGRARFEAAYGPLSLADTVRKAYLEIFGQTPSGEKASLLLSDAVPDGRGGTYSRAAYFAELAQDTPEGLGTKAALVGWLLAQAAKETLGPYVSANAAFLQDLALDGHASFNVDLLAAYGPRPQHAVGPVIGLDDDVSARPDHGDPALRTTGDSDTVLATLGLGPTQSIITGDGHDLVDVSGVGAGYVEGGGGDDTLIAGSLVRVEVLGAPNSGRLLAGAGNDTLRISTGVGAGARVDGGAGDDTLTTQGLAQGAELAAVEHLWITGTPAFGPPPSDPRFIKAVFTVDLAHVSGVQDVWNITQGYSTLQVTGASSRVLLGLKDTAGSLRGEFAGGTREAHLFLDNVLDPRLAGGALSNGALFYGVTGELRVHVTSSSSIGEIFHRDGSALSIDGLGALRAGSVQIGPGLAGFPPLDVAPPVTHRLDASRALSVDIGHYAPGAADNEVLLSDGADRLGVYLYAKVRTSFTLGAGEDTLRIAVAAPPSQNGTAPALANLSISDGQVRTFATVLDFSPGDDRLELGALVNQASPRGAGAGDNLEAVLVTLSGGLAAGTVAVFAWAGDTWIYRQDATVGVNTGDGLIRLVGVTGLSVGLAGGDFDITYGG
ncbi:hypothetical protein [Phenylobacterium sp.]|jgi:hypothetical protein|uniref:hypothetical protein n=1 Tax=Phenylobacterium sp. TaxID=1871053 RepID=UPI002F95CE22